MKGGGEFGMVWVGMGEMEQGMRTGMVATASMQWFMRALQATNMELRQMVGEAMLANPALEEVTRAEDAVGAADADDAGGAVDHDATRRHGEFMESLAAEETLASHLEGELRRSGLPAAVESAALMLVGCLDEHGYFDEPPAEIAAREGVDAAVFRAALAALQEQEPAGVGACGLQESLLIQLRRAGEDGDSPAVRLVREQWDALVHHRYAEAARALGVPEECVVAAAYRVSRLNPDPGSGFAQAERHVIAPDVVVVRDAGGRYVARLTGENIPQLELSAEYREMMAEQADKPEVRQYLSRCFREGRDVIRAIAERQSTILAVAQAVVARQQDFFRRGRAELLPLRMEDISADTGLSVSTVSRAVSGKYLRCSHGVYALRSFFSASLPAAGEAAVSADAVQQQILRLVQAEDPAHPLSDAALEAALAEQGIAVARRTVAKYREKLKILPTNLRRRK